MVWKISSPSMAVENLLYNTVCFCGLLVRKWWDCIGLLFCCISGQEIICHGGSANQKMNQEDNALFQSIMKLMVKQQKDCMAPTGKIDSSTRIVFQLVTNLASSSSCRCMIWKVRCLTSCAYFRSIFYEVLYVMNLWASWLRAVIIMLLSGASWAGFIIFRHIQSINMKTIQWDAWSWKFKYR